MPAHPTWHKWSLEFVCPVWLHRLACVQLVELLKPYVRSCLLIWFPVLVQSPRRQITGLVLTSLLSLWFIWLYFDHILTLVLRPDKHWPKNTKLTEFWLATSKFILHDYIYLTPILVQIYILTYILQRNTTVHTDTVTLGKRRVVAALKMLSFSLGVMRTDKIRN